MSMSCLLQLHFGDDTLLINANQSVHELLIRCW